MNYKVVFYTRTNTSKKIAETIASELSCELVEITDDIDWKGLKGFFKAGRYSANDLPVEIKINGNLKSADEYILVAPMWAGGLAPAARTFLKTVPKEKIHLIVASIGNSVKDTSGFKSVRTARKITRNAKSVISDLVNSLIES